ncbi:amidase family protein [Mesorhizobium sp. M0955]|uniref:amidase family protein n=1 Tax=Mesorhizobium sp. M0955 TaxID=2957033 RepID=UPI0033360E03
MTKAVRDPQILGPVPVQPITSAALPLVGIRLALVAQKDYPVPVDDEVSRVLEEAVVTFRRLGATVETVALPFNFARLMDMTGLLISAEAYAYHRDYIHHNDLLFDAMVRERLLEGGRIAASDYIAALNYHLRMCTDWIAWTRDHQALLTPCLTAPALPLAEDNSDLSSPSAFTRAGNFIDATGLALPAGFSTNGVPIGVQLLGAPHMEDLLTAIGAAFQRETDWHLRTPTL